MRVFVRAQGGSADLTLDTDTLQLDLRRGPNRISALRNGNVAESYYNNTVWVDAAGDVVACSRDGRTSRGGNIDDPATQRALLRHGFTNDAGLAMLQAVHDNGDTLDALPDIAEDFDRSTINRVMVQQDAAARRLVG